MVTFLDEATGTVRTIVAEQLIAAGVHPKVAQDIMGRSDIKLTMSFYKHTLRGQKSEVAEALPDLSLSGSQQQAKTGTDDVLKTWRSTRRFTAEKIRQVWISVDKAERIV